jgi:hypothetical protein
MCRPGMSTPPDASSGADVSARFAPLASSPTVIPASISPAAGENAGPAPGGQQAETVHDEADRLVILTPCYGHQLTESFVQSFLSVYAGAPSARFRLPDGSVQVLPIVATLITQPGESHIDRGRNTLIWQARQTHYRNFLWADADQPFEPHHIAITWARLMSGVRVIGGSVALKTIVTTFAANLEIGKTGRDRDAAGLLPGRDTGTGWMGFRRDVIDEIIERWPKLVREQIRQELRDTNATHGHVELVLYRMACLGYSADLDYKSQSNSATRGQTMHAIFASGIAFREGARDWLSEDWMFCHRCLLLGIPIKIDPLIRIKHLGPMLYPPAPEELIDAAIQATSGDHPPFDRDLSHAAADALRRLRADIRDDTISILHPTRRPEQALARWAQWRERALRHDGYEYIFGVDAGDTATINALLAAGARYVITPDGGKGIVAAMNAAAAEASGRILVMAADDCEPPQHWDRQIREALKGQLHLPRLLWTSDGHSDQPVITHPIMTRALYQRQGWFFCPEYPHLFCDTELTERAMQAGEIIDARHIELRHHHPMFTGAAPDALHQERNTPGAWATGRAIFERRNPHSRHPHLHR